MSSLLFVYGTLKRGGSRHSALSSQRFICEAATTSPCRLFSCGSYPALQESRNGTSIRGELYEVSEDCLRLCDAIEGVGEGLYVRRLTGVVSIDNPEYAADAWTYFYLKSTLNLPDCGREWTS